MDNKAFIGKVYSMTVAKRFKDKYEIVTVGFRKFAVTPGKFLIDEEVVVIGRDCVLPSAPNLEQLKSYNIQFADELVSDGMIAPMHILGGGRYPVGQDVTQVLGITSRTESYDIGSVQ